VLEEEKEDRETGSVGEIPGLKFKWPMKANNRNYERVFVAPHRGSMLEFAALSRILAMK
jgi:hypothetical protein